MNNIVREKTIILLTTIYSLNLELSALNNEGLGIEDAWEKAKVKRNSSVKSQHVLSHSVMTLNQFPDRAMPQGNNCGAAILLRSVMNLNIFCLSSGYRSLITHSTKRIVFFHVERSSLLKKLIKKRH